MTSRSLRGLPVCFCNWIYLVTNFKFFSLLLIVHFVCLVLIHFVAVVVVSEINLFDLILRLDNASLVLGKDTLRIYSHNGPSINLSW